jgi:hypothetical protein
MNQGDRGYIRLDLAYGSGKGGFNFTQGTAGQQKRIVMVMQRNGHDAKEKTGKRQKYNSFDLGLLHKTLRVQQGVFSYHLFAGTVKERVGTGCLIYAAPTFQTRQSKDFTL